MLILTQLIIFIALLNHGAFLKIPLNNPRCLRQSTGMLGTRSSHNPKKDESSPELSNTVSPIRSNVNSHIMTDAIFDLYSHILSSKCIKEW